MSDQIAPGRDQLFQRAVRDAYDVLDSHYPLTEEVVAEAIEAAQAVYDADQEAYVQRQVDEAKLEHFRVGSDGIDGRFVMARETAAGLVVAAKSFLDLYPDAENYVEQQVFDRETGDRYLITFTKPGGKTPHELRRQAEAERDRLAAELERLRRWEVAGG